MLFRSWGDESIGKTKEGWCVRRNGPLYQLYIIRKIGPSLPARPLRPQAQPRPHLGPPGNGGQHQFQPGSVEGGGMNYKRTDDGVIDVLAERVEGLCIDIGEMKIGISKMADALTKLAIVEERQTQTILAQERAFKALERVEERQRQHELQCRDQEKEVRQLIAEIGRASCRERV